MKSRTIVTVGAIILALIIVRNILTGKETPAPTESVRTPKVVETQLIGLGDFSEQVSVIGRVAPIRETTISTQATGFIGSVPVEAGDRVVAGQILATIADSYGLSGYALEEAEIGVTSAGLTRDNTIISLEQSLESARINLERAQKDYDSTKLSGEEDTVLSKAELDLQNYITTQEKTLAGYEITYQNQLQNFQSLIANVIDTTDILVGVSEINKSRNDTFEMFLGVRDSAQKTQAELSIQRLIPYKTWTPDPTKSLTERVQEMQKVYFIVNDVLTQVETMLINTITDSARFTDSDLAAYRSTIDGYQTQYSTVSGGLVSYLNTAQSFLATYEKERLSREQWVAITAENNRNALELAKKAYEAAKKARDIGVAQAEQSVNSASLRLLNASGNAAKLTVTAPFSGVIIARGAEVGNLASPGANLFTLGDTSQLIVTVDISVEQQKYLILGDDIPLYFRGKNIMGKLSSLSAGPDPQTRLYRAEIALTSSQGLSLGDIVEVVLPWKTLTIANENWQIVLPFSAIKNLGQETYAVFVFVPDETKKGTGTVRERIVKLGETNENSVTIAEWLSLGERVVRVGMLGIDDGDYVQDPALDETEETAVPDVEVRQ